MTGSKRIKKALTSLTNLRSELEKGYTQCTREGNAKIADANKLQQQAQDIFKEADLANEAMKNITAILPKSLK